MELVFGLVRAPARTSQTFLAGTQFYILDSSLLHSDINNRDMSEIFDAYLNDLTFLAGDIRNNLVTLKSGENVEGLPKTINTVFDQANDLIKQAEIEARSHESKERKYLNDRLKNHKEIFAALKSEYDGELFQNQKAQLVGRSGEDRGRMLESNEKIRRQNEIIENCMRTVAETEDIGVETILELKSNREKIDSARAKTAEFQGVADDADKRLKSMWFRHKTWGLFG